MDENRPAFRPLAYSSRPARNALAAAGFQLMHESVRRECPELAPRVTRWELVGWLMAIAGAAAIGGRASTLALALLFTAVLWPLAVINNAANQSTDPDKKGALQDALVLIGFPWAISAIWVVLGMIVAGGWRWLAILLGVIALVALGLRWTVLRSVDPAQPKQQHTAEPSVAGRRYRPAHARTMRLPRVAAVLWFGWPAAIWQGAFAAAGAYALVLGGSEVARLNWAIGGALLTGTAVALGSLGQHRKRK